MTHQTSEDIKDKVKLALNKVKDKLKVSKVKATGKVNKVRKAQKLRWPRIRAEEGQTSMHMRSLPEPMDGGIPTCDITPEKTTASSVSVHSF